jgi:acetolactate synthase-1/3 small subunit
MAEIFRSRVVDISTDYYTLEVTGNESKVEAFMKLLKPIGIKEIARTGVIALARENK